MVLPCFYWPHASTHIRSFTCKVTNGYLSFPWFDADDPVWLSMIMAFCLRNYFDIEVFCGVDAVIADEAGDDAGGFWVGSVFACCFWRVVVIWTAWAGGSLMPDFAACFDGNAEGEEVGFQLVGGHVVLEGEFVEDGVFEQVVRFIF